MLPQVDWAAKNRYNGISWQAHHKPGSVGEELGQMRNCGVLAALDWGNNGCGWWSYVTHGSEGMVMPEWEPDSSLLQCQI